MKITKEHKFRSYSQMPKNIYNISINQLNTLKENSCIILSFSNAAYNYIESNIIKAHIFFGKSRPEIYLNPKRNVFGFALHSNCYSCKIWLTHCIYGNKQIITKFISILSFRRNPIVLTFSPYVNKMIICSEISNKDIVDKTIVKKIIPEYGNLYISERIKKSNDIKQLIDIFKERTKNVWYNTGKYNFPAARCSIFMNFVGENDIFHISNIFPKDVYREILNICEQIKNKNYLLFPKKEENNNNNEKNNENEDRINNNNEKNNENEDIINNNNEKNIENDNRINNNN